ncbi:uncharacterized protein C8Q71DRAFT_421767 [Rhodofomes roseus]|uniref:Inositol-pentakisphosphate 2-kinase n=1 Tax=Rhodofomes roseus TaxID=34475 RepID=A0ABQ8KSE6_9APHY|nr:uncharacterized protein C8Q71DRAFT_421767 [Rhodofomes roseus]KAH9840746.1 hypothetical protein C8Q71DRAFT_421767 [Rhodofomes roseus]
MGSVARGVSELVEKETYLPESLGRDASVTRLKNSCVTVEEARSARPVGVGRAPLHVRGGRPVCMEVKPRTFIRFFVGFADLQGFAPRKVLLGPLLCRRPTLAASEPTNGVIENNDHDCLREGNAPVRNDSLFNRYTVAYLRVIPCRALVALRQAEVLSSISEQVRESLTVHYIECTIRGLVGHLGPCTTTGGHDGSQWRLRS